MSEHRDHAYRVALSLKDQPAWVRVAAVLHDVMEDEVLTLSDIIETFDVLRGLAAGTSLRIADAVVMLSRRADETYEAYIDRLCCPPSPNHAQIQAIKIADLEDNLEHMDAEHESLRPRYEKALARLKEAVGDE